MAGGAIAGRAAEGARGMTGLALDLLVRRVEEEAGRVVVEAQGRRACRFRLRKGRPPQSQHDRDGDEKDDEKTAQTGQRIVIRLS